MARPVEITLLAAEQGGFAVFYDMSKSTRPAYAGSLEDCLEFIRNLYLDAS